MPGASPFVISLVRFLSIYLDDPRILNTPFVGVNSNSPFFFRNSKPVNFKARDDLYGNLGWDVISKAVTTVSIAAYDDTEFWIDDVVLYGVKPSDFASSPNPSRN